MPDLLYAVMDARGECYAICERREEGDAMRYRARQYLSEAATCGQPGAQAWADERRPIRVEFVSEERAREIREDGPPVLEREP
jgi:hypothetical protein